MKSYSKVVASTRVGGMSRGLGRGCETILLLFAFCLIATDLAAQSVPPNNVTYFTNPRQTVSEADTAEGHEVILRAELSAYGNYGVADGSSDILYTGEVATWHFDLPSTLSSISVQKAYFRTSLIADDHYGVSLDLYSLAAWTNALYQGKAQAGLPHGSPFGSRFSNWVQRDFPVQPLSSGYDLTLFNTSGVGNWFAIDWIELHVLTGPSKSLPATVSPNLGGTSGFITASITGTASTADPLSVALASAGKPSMIGQNPRFLSPDEIVVTFDLRGQSSGKRDVVVTRSDSSVITIPASFDVVDGGGSRLVLDLVGPTVARVNRDTTFSVYARNTGLNDVGVLTYDFNTDNQALGTLTVNALTSSQGTMGGISPGGIVGTSGVFRFPTCNGLTFKVLSEKDPDPCEPIRRKIRKLKTDIERVSKQVSDLRQVIRASNCEVDPPAGQKGSAYCLRLIAQYDQLRAQLDSLYNQLTVEEALLAACEERNSGSSSLRAQSLAQSTSTGGSTSSIQTTICPVFSWDPNDKTGPAGVTGLRYVTPSSTMPYTVFFENKAQATARAQDIVVTDQLPSTLDLSTLLLGTIRFGDRTIDVPYPTQNFSATVDLRPAKPLLVEINVTLNVTTRTLTWQFRSIDPNTGASPTDPLAGFLPPNKTPPEGEGSVSFSIRPAAGLLTGQSISNTAQIVFDSNAVINTPTWTNVVDTTQPISHVSPLPSTQSQHSFQVQWTGSDSASGIQDYTVYVSDNAGPFTIWTTTTANFATFTGMMNHSYGFFVLARDLAGNSETFKTSPEATTAVVAGPTIQCTGCYFLSGGLRATFAFKVSSPGSSSTFTYNYRSSTQTVQFTSTTTSQVMLDGNSATFAGTGVLNGQSGYSFSVTAKDGGAAGSGLDTVAVTITGPGNDLYTVNSAIAGGDIVVHQ